MNSHRTAPLHRSRLGVLALAALATLTAGALTGCSVVDELAYRQSKSDYATLAEAPDTSLAHADWVPADATDIHIVETNRADAVETAAVLVTSSSALDPTVCAPTERLSSAAYSIEGAPDPYKAKDAFACGDWTVIASTDGWFGWTPNSPTEAEHSPSAAAD